MARVGQWQEWDNGKSGTMARVGQWQEWDNDKSGSMTRVGNHKSRAMTRVPFPVELKLL